MEFKGNIYELKVFEALMIFSFLGSPPPPVKVSSEPPQATTNSVPTVPQLPSSDAFAAVAQLFQTTQGQQVTCLSKD